MCNMKLLSILLSFAALSIFASPPAGELTLEFEAKFDALPAERSALALLPVTADKEGHVIFTISADPVSLDEDWSFKTVDTVKSGEWHRFTLTYSLLQRRIRLKMDGRHQYENDHVYLPKPKFGPAEVAKDFPGEVKNLSVRDVALRRELLESVDRREELEARLKKEWDANPKAVKTRSLAFYTIDPMSQERVLPDMIPGEADFSGSLDVVVAQEEFEPASFVVMALKPVKSFTVRMKGLDGLLADVKLVKRWYRPGGAWYTYFTDFYHRVLTPHLLVNDDKLIKVDEPSTRNYYRLNYPEGTRYTDVSDPDKREGWDPDIPFRDAKTLQPIDNLTAFGRNQQYWILFHAAKGTKPGLYRGELELIAEGDTVAMMPVNLRVLDFELPVRGESFDNDGQFYISHLNIYGSEFAGHTFEELKASWLKQYKSMRDHNSLDVTGIWKDEYSAALAREAGFPEDQIWASGINLPKWRKLWSGVPFGELTAEKRELGIRAAERLVKRGFDWYDKAFHASQKWAHFFSEDSSYISLGVMQRDLALTVHKHGWNMFAHGMGSGNFDFAGDLQDAQMPSYLDRKLADQWHAVGSPVAAYAKPFASPENPAIHRRYLGFLRYLHHRYDGNMQHGLKDMNPNQFAPNPGGDGNFRCQTMLYPTQDGFLETICWEGVREAFDDVRYATYLKKLAKPRLHDANEYIRREARRAMQWLVSQDGNASSMTMIRLGIIDRILGLRKTIIDNGGTL